jgi:hypothetical protein
MKMTIGTFELFCLNSYYLTIQSVLTQNKKSISSNIKIRIEKVCKK